MKTIRFLLAAFGATGALSAASSNLSLEQARRNLADALQQYEQAQGLVVQMEAAAARPAAPAVRTATAELQEAGLGRLMQKGSAERRAILGANGIDPALFSTELETLRSREAAGAPLAGELGGFLTSYGYKEVQENARANGRAVDPAQTAAAAQAGAKPVEEPEVKSRDEVLLRNAGIAFSQGFAVIFSDAGDDEASVGTIFARWNWLQRSAAGKWNRWIGEKNPEGYAMVPYRGHIEYRDEDGTYTETKPEGRSTRTLPELTFFGPIYGTAALGEKISNGTDTFRPYLVGLSLGWGFLDEAAPLVYVDAGATVSPSDGFEDSRFFAGISCDALVLGKILGLTRKAGAQ